MGLQLVQLTISTIWLVSIVEESEHHSQHQFELIRYLCFAAAEYAL